MPDDRQPTEHDLKILPPFYDMVAAGDKTFELRKNDRDFRISDTLLLREWSERNGYSGRQLRKKVTCITRGHPWLIEGVVCMGLQDV